MSRDEFHQSCFSEILPPFIARLRQAIRIQYNKIPGPQRSAIFLKFQIWENPERGSARFQASCGKGAEQKRGIMPGIQVGEASLAEVPLATWRVPPPPPGASQRGSPAVPGAGIGRPSSCATKLMRFRVGLSGSLLGDQELAAWDGQAEGRADARHARTVKAALDLAARAAAVAIDQAAVVTRL